MAARLNIAAGFHLRRDPGPFAAVAAGTAAPAAGSRVLALAGIARPERFFEELAAAGLDVRARLAFRDHHPYSTEDLRRIRREMDASGAATVVTTEKDLVRLRPLGGLPFGVAWRRLDVQPRDPDAFCGWIDRRLSEIRQARARQGETVA